MTPEDATQIVRTETERELLHEVRTQSERKLQKLKESGVEALRGNVTVFLPYELCREAFEGVPPDKGI